LAIYACVIVNGIAAVTFFVGGKEAVAAAFFG